MMTPDGAKECERLEATTSGHHLNSGSRFKAATQQEHAHASLSIVPCERERR
jgi:hypothetical protein